MSAHFNPIYRAFGERLLPLMEELNLTLAA